MLFGDLRVKVQINGIDMERVKKNNGVMIDDHHTQNTYSEKCQTQKTKEF